MTTLTIDTVQEYMQEALAKGLSYEFLTLAEPYLAARPDDAYIRLMAAREFLKLGLLLPARELLDGADGAAETASDLKTVRQAILGIRTQEPSWIPHESRFNINLDALAERGFDADTLRLAWERNRDSFQLFQDANGSMQVRRQEEPEPRRSGRADGRWYWIPSLRNQCQAEATQVLPDDIQTNTPGPYLFEGLGFGGYFERIYEATRDTFLGFSCALFIVEPDPAMLAVVLHLRDWSALLRDPRVMIFTGDNWTDQLRAAWSDDPDLPFPNRVITTGSSGDASGVSAVHVVRESVDQREREIRKTLAEVDQQYARRDIAYWSQRFDEALSGRGAPLRILSAVSTHTTFLQYSMRDAREAFTALGHECLVLSEKTPYGAVGPLRYLRAILDFDPDLFFSIDHLRPEFGGVIPYDLPILTWDQDQLPQVITRENLAKLAPHDFIVGCSKIPCVRLGANPRQMRYTLVPTCPDQFGGDPLTDQERARYTCDVSFVSHASQTPRAFHEEERNLYRDDAARRLLDALFELMPAAIAQHHVPGGHLTDAVLEEGMRQCGIAQLPPELETRLKQWYLWRLGDRIFRHGALEWAAEWARSRGRSLRIYGNGWDQHPTLAEFAAGPAANGRELLCVYRASKINLQLMPAGFLHQRAMDGLAAGGFFLSRMTPRDVSGRTLRRFAARMAELGIDSTAALLQCPDEMIRASLQQLYGPWLDRIDPADGSFLQNILITAELRFPDELFPRFGEIVFDSSESFFRAADRFVDDDTARRMIADEMREVVVRELSYQPTMDRFLREMAGYLREMSETVAHPET
jgi:hypothetical protein